MSIESVMPCNHLIFCCPLLHLPSIFPSIGSFLMSWLFESGGQSIRASASAPSLEGLMLGRSISPSNEGASVLPMNIQGWFPLGLTGLIPWLSKGLSRVFSNTTVKKHKFFCAQPSWWSDFYICTQLVEKPSKKALTIQTFVSKVMSLLLIKRGD